MKSNRRWIVGTLLASLVVLSGFYGLSLWNKSEFCLGWAAHYAERAAMLESEQMLAIAENRPEDAAAYEDSALEMAIISRKYHRVANNPLLPYPSKPLVTDIEVDDVRHSK